MGKTKKIVRLRATATRCRQLADQATDLEAEEALRGLASDIDILVTVFRDAPQGPA